MKPVVEPTKAGDARKPYSKPEVVKYGPLEKLTQSGGITHPDGSGGTKKVGQV